MKCQFPGKNELVKISLTLVIFLLVMLVLVGCLGSVSIKCAYSQRSHAISVFILLKVSTDDVISTVFPFSGNDNSVIIRHITQVAGEPN